MKKLFILLLWFLFSQLKPHAQISAADSLIQRLPAAAEDSNRVVLLGKISGEYMWFFPDSAKPYAREGLQLSKKLNYKHGEAVCSFNLCVSLLQEGDFTSALDYGFKALSLFEDAGDSQNVSTTHAILMICYREQGDYNQALIQGYKAKESWALSREDSVIVLGNISSVYEKNNQPDSAMYYGLKVYTLDSAWGGVLVTLGNVFYKLKDPQKSLYYYRKGIPSTSGWGLMDIFLGISKTFELIGLPDSSIHYARRSFLLSQEINHPRGSLDAARQLADYYEKEGNSDSTVKYLKLASILNDSLFSRQKTSEAQSFAFNEKIHRQELEAQEIQNKSRTKLYALLAIVIVFIIFSLIQYRNSKHRKAVNIQLQKQKKKVEETLDDLKSAQAQLIQSEKMASLGQLTAGIAHEIQNPLNFVNNFSEINNELIEELKSQKEKLKTEEHDALLSDIFQNNEKITLHGKRADAIVKNMLEHSRQGTGQKQMTDINALADEYLKLAYHGMRAKDKEFNATIKTDFDNSIGKINIIPQDIGRVLLNLYNNAFYAAPLPPPGGGGFREPDGKHIPTVWVSTKKEDGKVLIAVKDNGPGIPNEIIDKIFQPFFTTKPTGQGTGLGLSLAYDIVKVHGGEISAGSRGKAETAGNEGTTFIIQLPFR